MERRFLPLWGLVAPRNPNPQASLRISLLDEEDQGEKPVAFRLTHKRGLFGTFSRSTFRRFNFTDCNWSGPAISVIVSDYGDVSWNSDCWRPDLLWLEQAVQADPSDWLKLFDRRLSNEPAFYTMKRTAQLYLIIVSVVGLGIFFILHAGTQLPSPVSRLPNGSVAVTTPNSTALSGSSFFAAVQSGLRQNATNPLSRLFLQLFIIIGASGVVAWLFTRCGQTAVIGEMVAGILLGPSLFGLLAPNAFQFIFAPSSLEALRMLSQIGVCLFLFTVGMELDVSEVRHKAQTAVDVRHTRIVLPYIVGVAPA
jgi:hypothetical protein